MSIKDLYCELRWAIEDRVEFFRRWRDPEIPPAHRAVYERRFEAAKRETEMLVARIGEAERH